MAHLSDELARLALVALGTQGPSMTHQALEDRIRPNDPGLLFGVLRDLVRDGILWFEGSPGPDRVWILLPHCDTRQGLYQALPGLDPESVRDIAAVLDRHTSTCPACSCLPQAAAWRQGRVPA